ncbi:MAG: hypothetical protein A3D65_02105 [Candidatus Lloydbacteria bacterium RIFCSPHIGHO2_02_FULL_50_13]|uniref:Uncharacterized protein n=1 Tax=Candidatus Lloydbacteria bacterium RIFCSPHIGHO2_02_FULL_50_13 TaxID=1798661 RepID=A0A1G2D1C9_9BACT|nr:MAG: hypothetical protein A3D65_02105 [Candidatus Lloydbacteria bacterium RIFCSPHIGHO2_02_FULL_50_13]
MKRHMAFVATFFLFLYVPLCTNASEWFTGKQIPVLWHKNVEGEAFVDGKGVCNAFAPNTPIGLEKLGEQVQACFYGKTPKKKSMAPSEQASVLVSWQQIRTSDAPRLLKIIRPKDDTAYASPETIEGFFKKDQNGVCFVYVARDNFSILGHEVKHCFDGYFHAPVGYWYDVPANSSTK